MASLLEGLLEARDFVLQARDAARDSKVINKEDGPDGEIGGHQAIATFHGASDSFRPTKAASSRESHGQQELCRVNKAHGVFSARQQQLASPTQQAKRQIPQ